MAVSYEFTSTYDSLKKVIADILSSPDKQNVGGLSLSYDSETGKIVGNLNVNRYYLTGTEDVYESPDTGVIQKGSDNIFGTIENPDR